MHQTRKEAASKLPIKRKGTKYLARARSHLYNSVPVIIAMRDMLGLAAKSKEVKQMIHQKLLKINGKPALDLRDSIKLFNLFEADQLYRLSLLPTGKFTFIPLAKKENRLCKIISKRLISSGRIQLNLHDGTNVISSIKRISTGDSVVLDERNKILSHIPMEKGREVFIISGRKRGLGGKISSIEGSIVRIKLINGEEAALEKSVLFIIK